MKIYFLFFCKDIMAIIIIAIILYIYIYDIFNINIFKY